MHEKNNKEPIEGVNCIVNTCHYHLSENKCSASAIDIQPKNASSSEETDCGTFKPDNNSLK